MPTARDDILLNKAAIIERCIRRIKEENALSPELQSHTHVDAMILNIERACQAAIDMAMHLAAKNHLGIPQSSADAFTLLASSGLIDESVCTSMRRMTGFRNVAVHQYQALDLEVLGRIAGGGYMDLVTFCSALGLNIAV